MEKDLKEMKKEELVDMVQEMEGVLIELEGRLGKGKKFKKSRKDEVLELLMAEKSISVVDMAKRLGTTGKNISSYLTYLRNDGYKIGTRSNGKKFIEIDEVEN